MPKAVQGDRVHKVAALLQIENLLDRKPGALSGGQRQRVAMGRALVREPVLFLFDEPLSNLDAKLRVELRGEIKRLHERLNASIVYVTHDQIEAMTLGTHIVVLNQGVIQQAGTPEDIYERPANLFVADFMGSPPMNLVPGTLVSGSAGTEVLFPGGQGVSLPSLPEALRGYVGRDIVFGFRPETLQLGPGLKLDAQLVENSGSDTFVTLDLGGKAIVARLSGRVKVAHGASIELAVDAAHSVFFDPVSGLRIR